ncbi:MAG TPA: hypothetical protein VEG34_01010 [Thermoanaerobaculia bacterium]|nr:hypothetical protein [Thermoanaerobaculia bacterium]
MDTLPHTPLTSLLQYSFRAGSGYRLVVFDRLPPEEQAALAELQTDPDFYGVLLPREGSLRTVKAVGRDTALLWWTLTEPGPLPFFVWSGGTEGAEAAQGIIDLVMDGVLEIADGEGFVAGAAAAGLLLPASSPRTSQGKLAQLSAEALRHAEALGAADPAVLVASLYGYNRQPVTAAWARRLPDRPAVLDFLGAAPASPLGRRLAAGWDRASGEAEPEGWIAWRYRGRKGAASNRSSGASAGRAAFKLYLSPAIEALPAAFAAVVETLEDAGRGDFKVGSDAAGLLRPDKLVLYFSGQEELLAAAENLSRRLPGLPTQGVPFTAEIGLDGALSWGMDPPKSARLVSWHEGESWRIWVVRRLALALLAARDGMPEQREQHQVEGGLEPWQFALERLRREGVDVDRWTPAAHIWQAAA